jgi:alanine racemase
MVDNAFVTVDLDQIRENFRLICQKSGVPVMAVVKADAYGHGALPVARALEEMCAFFGVANLSEALELRRGGIQKPVLVLGPMAPENFPEAILADVRLCISCYEDACQLSCQAEKLGKTARFHLAVDTGMSRIGLQVTPQDADIAAAICNLPGLEPEGLFSHFATADGSELSRTHAQAEKFRLFDEMLKARGVTIPLRHIDNSAGIVHFGAHYEMSRAGIILYGMAPSGHVDLTGLPVQAALSWCSRVSHLKTLEPGREVSYGGTFVTEKPTRVATVPVGYADGYSRCLSGRFYVLIHG